jgi:hypothetical protein
LLRYDPKKTFRNIVEASVGCLLENEAIRGDVGAARSYLYNLTRSSIFAMPFWMAVYQFKHLRFWRFRQIIKLWKVWLGRFLRVGLDRYSTLRSDNGLEITTSVFGVKKLNKQQQRDLL